MVWFRREKVKFLLFSSSEFEARPSKYDGVDDTLGSVDRDDDDDDDDDDGSWTTNDDQDEQGDDDARECRS